MITLYCCIFSLARNKQIFNRKKVKKIMPKITKNSRGTWGFVVDLGTDPATGKRRQARRSGFRTKKEAEEELRRLQNEADKGVVVKKQDGNITFEEFSQDWLEWYAATAGVKESTVTNRRRYLRQACQFIGGMKIKEFGKSSYNQFLIALHERYAKSTTNSISQTVSMILNYAVECSLLITNPAQSAIKPKTAAKLEDVPENIEEKYLSRAEVDRLLSAAKECGDFQYYALIHLLLFSGIRIGEALALEFKHIDAAGIKIRQTFSTGASASVEKYTLETPKTSRSIRDIELDTYTLEIVQAQMLDQKKKRLKAGATWDSQHNFIFTAYTKPGLPLSYVTAAYKFKRLLTIAEIGKKATLHTLRHTHASLLAESGASLEQIQARLGHSNDKITREIYLHITKDSSALMMENFAAYMQM